jgi:hypothetical protein
VSEGTQIIELPANHHWVVVDLNEILDELRSAGFPNELIATYIDGNSRRRFVCVTSRRNHANGNGNGKVVGS